MELYIYERSKLVRSSVSLTDSSPSNRISLNGETLMPETERVISILLILFRLLQNHREKMKINLTCHSVFLVDDAFDLYFLVFTSVSPGVRIH